MIKDHNLLIFRRIIEENAIPLIILRQTEIVYYNAAFDRLMSVLKSTPEAFVKKYITETTDGELYLKYASKEIFFNIYSTTIDQTYQIFQLINNTEAKIHQHNLENTIKSLHEQEKIRNHFLENLSHELRTPLTGIIGFTDLLKYTELSQDAMTYIDGLTQSANRMVQTLNSINEFTMLISDTVTLVNETIDLEKIVKKVCNSFYYQAKAKNLSLKLSSEIIPDIPFVSDGGKIEIILKHLISNAIKFTEKGSINVSYHLTHSECTLKIEDTGIGIPEEKLDEIFEDFKQLSEGYNRHYEGSGLGLGIVRKLVNHLGGQVRVTSIISKGSTFTVTLPNRTLKPEKTIVTPKKSRSNSILYIEDNYLNQKLLQISLGKLYHITLAQNADDGIAKVKNRDFDLILMDINLGKGMDGIQAMKEIRKLPDKQEIPIIALTAYALADDRQKFLNEGFDDYIAKPYTKDEIIHTINKFLLQ
jgi:signal transduction histidine kinase